MLAFDCSTVTGKHILLDVFSMSELILSDMRAEVTDLDYVRQLEVTSDLLTVLTPGQRFKKTKKSGKAVQKSDNRSLRRHVPPPDGEIARMTIDIFK